MSADRKDKNPSVDVIQAEKKRRYRVPSSETGPLRGKTPGARIVEAMQRKGLRKMHLHERVGVSYQTVISWCNDSTPPSAANFQRLADVLEVPVQWLLRGVDEKGEPDFEAWREFLKSPPGSEITPEERESLASILWPSDKEPSLLSYGAMLSGLRYATPRKKAPRTK